MRWREIDRRQLALAVAAVALAVWVLGFATRGLLSGDSGVKLAQAHSLWESGFSTRELLYDHELDPKERFFPYGEFVIKVDGRRQGVYSLTFTAIAAPLIGILGLTGTMLLGLAGGIAILFGVDRLLGRMGASEPARVAAAVVTVALTPVLLYTAQFAEHTPAVGLAILALGFVVPRDDGTGVRPLLAGALVAFAATMRAECYLAVATIGLALVVRPEATWTHRLREGALYIGGALAVLVPYWGLNLLVSDTWDPMVTFQKPAPDRWANVVKMLIGETKPRPAFWLAILCLAAAGGLAVPPRHARALPGTIVRVVLGLALVWLAWRISRVATGRTLIGTFSVTPIAAYGLIACAWHPRWRQVWLYAVLTTIGIVALNKSNDAGGLQLGARLVLPALPALLALAAAAIDDDARARRWPTLLAPALLLVLTVVMFTRALPPAYEIAAKGERAATEVAAAPARVVVTRVWWESQVLTPALLADKTIYLTGRDLRPIMETLAAAGVTEAIVINKGPVELTLPSGAVVHTTRSRTAWLQLHDVTITPRSEESSPPAPSSP